jgi:hypothetical protein
VTEGEKKAASAVQEGIHCVGLQGVGSWSDPGPRAAEKCNGDRVSADTAPLKALLELTRKYKRVLILGDSDTASNMQSQKALKLLVSSLCKLGVRAAFACCPPTLNNDARGTSKKQGLDDWLVAGRTVGSSQDRDDCIDSIQQRGADLIWNIRRLTNLDGLPCQPS